MRSHKSPPDAAEEVWAYLTRWHPDDAAIRREDIEGRVQVLAKLGCDAARIYSALYVGVRIFKAHKKRLRNNANEDFVRNWQGRVLRDVEKALKSVEAWYRVDDDHDDNEELQSLRALARDLQEFPIILNEDTRKSRPRASRPRARRQPKKGHPWIYKQRTSALLTRLGVPEQERQALLAALGFIPA